MTDLPLIGPVAPTELHVMSYNIRRRFPALRPRSPDRWSLRAPLLRRLLRAERPTLIGVQEALPDQLGLVGDALGSSYRWVGRGRNADGGGEACALYFDTRRLELREWRQLALSATPGRPGSRSWGNTVPRTVVVAEFTDLATESRLIAFTTHFDHLSRRSRLASARMIAELAAAAHRDDPAAAIVVTGDLNAAPSSPVQHALTAGVLRDAWVAAAERVTPAWSTYSGYRRPRAGGRRIDAVLVGPGVEVIRAGINAVRFDGAAASDHEPVQAVVRGLLPHDA